MTFHEIYYPEIMDQVDNQLELDIEIDTLSIFELCMKHEGEIAVKKLRRTREVTGDLIHISPVSDKEIHSTDLN